MLSDNNHGSTCTLPSPEMRSHPGGYGMYTPHGHARRAPHLNGWVLPTSPKVWEEMTAAYEYGVREIRGTSVILARRRAFLLLDLAYDIDVWGGQDALPPSTPHRCAATWRGFTPATCPGIEGIITDYTRLLARRKHEKMGENTYHPT